MLCFALLWLLRSRRSQKLSLLGFLLQPLEIPEDWEPGGAGVAIPHFPERVTKPFPGNRDCNRALQQNFTGLSSPAG